MLPDARKCVRRRCGEFVPLFDKARRVSDRPPSSKLETPARAILFGANSPWNLTNFRLPLITSMQQRGHRILAAVPHDLNAAALNRYGIDVHEVPIDARAMSPLRDL